jgi:hypothetical protein
VTVWVMFPTLMCMVMSSPSTPNLWITINIVFLYSSITVSYW